MEKVVLFAEYLTGKGCGGLRTPGPTKGLTRDMHFGKVHYEW